MEKNNLTKIFLRALFGENRGFIEYRVLQTFDGKTRMFNHFFCETVDEAVSDEILSELGQSNYDERCDIYFGVLPRASQSGRQDNIQYITTLWSDLDGKDYAGGKSEALTRLCNFSQTPSVVIDSGNGYHAYWILQTAVPNENPKLIRGILKGIGQHLGADSVFDLCRILRLPNTMNWKGKEKPVACEIVERFFKPEMRYALADFGHYYVDPGTESTQTSLGPIPDEIPKRFQELLIKNKRLSDVWYGRATMPNNTTRSAYDMSIASILRHHYFTVEEIIAILPHAPSGKGCDATRQYLEHTIRKTNV